MSDKEESIDNDHSSELDRSEMGGVSAFDLPIPSLLWKEAWRRDHPSPIKLFGAWIDHNDPEYGLVRICWYMTKREKAIVMPYESLILDYDEDEGLESNMMYADACFLADEIEQLRECLRDPESGEDVLHVFEIDLPICDMCHSEFGDISGWDRFYNLSEEAAQNLPFSVYGKAAI